MDDQSFDTCLVNEEILVLQMGGTIDQDFPKLPHHPAKLRILEPASKRVLSKVRPLRSLILRFEQVATKDEADLTPEDRTSLAKVILTSSNRRFLVTHGTETITSSAAHVARTLSSSGAVNKAVVFTGSTTPERFRDSDADLNIGIALGFLQSGRTGVWVSLGGLVLPWDRAFKQKDGQFVPKRKSMPVLV